MQKRPEEQELAQRKKWGALVALSGAAIAAGGIAVWLVSGEPVAGGAMLGVGCAMAHRGWQAAASARLHLEFIKLAELDGQIQEELELRKAKTAEASRKEIAGIKFENVAGVFDGEPVFKYASKEGKRYEYAGIAGKSDEPNESTLIINDLVYRLASPS